MKINSKKEALGRIIFEFFDKESEIKFQKMFKQFQSNKKTHYEELGVCSLKGEKIPVIGNISGIKNKSGDLSFLTSTWVDISELNAVVSG